MQCTWVGTAGCPLIGVAIVLLGRCAHHLYIDTSTDNSIMYKTHRVLCEVIPILILVVIQIFNFTLLSLNRMSTKAWQVSVRNEDSQVYCIFMLTTS